MTRELLAVNLLFKALAVWLWRHSAVAAVAAFVAPDLHLLYGLLSPSSGIVVPMLREFDPKGRREVWLTIDDGPDPDDTPRILDALDRRGVKATFFVVGRRALRHPELVAEAMRRGHTVAHHTLSHPLALFWCAGPRAVRREIDGGLAALAQCAVRPAWFRPPAGIKNLFLRGALRRRGLACVGWTVRSGDGFGRTPEEIVRRVRDRAEPGAILLMHEGPCVPAKLRVRAIEQVVDALHEDGFVFVVPEPARLR